MVKATHRPLYPRERPGTHCIGGWVGPRADLDRCGKSRPYRDSNPGPSSPYRISIPTELPGPRCSGSQRNFIFGRGPGNSHKCKSYFKIRGAISVIHSNFCAQNPHILDLTVQNLLTLANCHCFLETENSLPYSNQPVIHHYSEPDHSCQRRPFLCLSDPF